MPKQHTITDVVAFNTRITFEFVPGEKPNTQTGIPRFVTVGKHHAFDFSLSVYREIAQNTLEEEFKGENYEIQRSALGDMPDYTFEVYQRYVVKKGK